MRAPKLFLLLSLTACAPKVAPPDVAAAEGVVIRTPPLDDRLYRYFELDNGMKVLVVHDADADMAAAALDVHVGQFSDPPDREGLAHFLEHMLFLGTDAYPDVDAYRDFVQSHGGGTNAGTGQEHTRYHFDVDHAHLEGALDRFSAFFTSPRLDREYVTREREAVNSEYRLKVQTQARRFREVRRATSNPDHGFAKFSVGNLDTLADRPDDAVWDDLRSFYDEQYSASRMALTVVGRQDLDTLEGFVRDRFSAVPTTGEPAPESTVPIHLPEQVGARIHVAPLDEIRELYLEFPVPSELTHHRSHALDLLTALIGQEGPGSPHEVLTDKGWITRLTTGDDGAEDHSLLTVRLTLTDAGYDHVDDVAGIILQYMRLASDPVTLEPYWEQNRTLNQLNFQFAEPARSSGLARNSARALQLYPPENVLDFWAVWDAYDPALVQEHIDRIRPDNMRMFITAPGLSTTEVEPRYDTAYGLTPIAPATIEHWTSAPTDPGLALPPMNPFVPEDTALLDASTDGTVPGPIVDEPGLRVWHLQDTSFKVPRAGLAATIHLPGKVTTLADKMNLRLWTALVQQHLASELDQARVANIQPFFNADPDGLYIEVRGYDDKLDEVLDALVAGALAAPIDPEQFDIIRRDRIRQYRNTLTDRPIDQVGWALNEAVNPTDWGHFPAADHYAALTVADLESWRASLFDSGLHIELLAHGNISAEDTEAAAKRLRTQLADAKPASPAPAVIRAIPEGRDLFRTVEVNHADSAIRVLFQGADPSLEAQATWLMLGTLMKTPAFTQLRTEQQLGYVVWARYDRREHVPGVSINIQSGVADPTKLLERIDAFLDGFGGYLAAMPEENYETVKAGLIASLEEAPTSLNQRTRELSRDLALGVTTFDRKAQLVGLLTALDKAEVEALLAEAVLGDKARRLVVQATGRTHADTPAPDGACADTACVVEKMGGAEVVRER